MITMLAMMAVLIGALLGQRFKVFILVPAIVIASTAILGFGMAHDDSSWSALLVAGLTITALQFGYFGGAVIHFLIASAPTSGDSHGTIVVAKRSVR
jgi:hypothetical protein